MDQDLTDVLEMMKNAKPSHSNLESIHSKNLDKSDVKYLNVSSGYKPPKDIRDKFRKD